MQSCKQAVLELDAAMTKTKLEDPLSEYQFAILGKFQVVLLHTTLFTC